MVVQYSFNPCTSCGRKLCNKVGIIKDGRLIAFGPTEEVTGDLSLEDVFMEQN